MTRKFIASLAMLPAIAFGEQVQRVECPAALPMGVIAVNTAPIGWTGGQTTSSMKLHGYGMRLGPPATMSNLVPSKSSISKGVSSSTWKFSAGEEKWLYCTYEPTGTIQVSKRLDDAITECTVQSTERSGSIPSAVAICTYRTVENR